MKIITSTLLLFFAALTANAQLAGTKWKGKVNIPNPTDVIFIFKDTVADVTTMSGLPVESCSYKINGDTIIFKKLNGGSPCPVNSMFTVQFAVKDDKMTIIPLTDDCEGRKGSFTSEPLVKMKD